MSSGKAFIENLLANGCMSAYNKQVEKATNPGKAYIENNISEFSKNKSNKTPLMSKSAEKPSIAQAIPFVADQTAKSENMFKQAEDVHNKAYADAGQAFSKYGNSEAFRDALIDNDANYKLGGTDDESKKVYTNTISSLYTESFLQELSESPTIDNYNKFINAYNTTPFVKAKISNIDALDYANSIMHTKNSDFHNYGNNDVLEMHSLKAETSFETSNKILVPFAYSIICVLVLSIATILIVNYKKTLCKKCGAKMPIKSRYCHICGERKNV